VEAKVLERKFC